MGRADGHGEVIVLMPKEITSFLNTEHSRKTYHFLPASVVIPMTSSGISKTMWAGVAWLWRIGSWSSSDL
jgi:hypothetical protein